jgi:hypothetical protein
MPLRANIGGGIIGFHGLPIVWVCAYTVIAPAYLVVVLVFQKALCAIIKPIVARPRSSLIRRIEQSYLQIASNSQG